MAKLIKFPLAMADGTKARSIEELREHSDVASIATYFEDGRLQRWLLANYLDDEAKKVEEIKELFDSENKKLKVQNIHKLYESLELGKVDEKQFSAYLENEPEVITNAMSLEVEDDPSIKEELKKLIHTDTKIDDWSISCEELEESNLYQVSIWNETLDFFSTFKLIKNELFFSKISATIYNIQKTFSKTENQQKNTDSFMEKVINTVFNTKKGQVVNYGKNQWRVIYKQEGEALLLSTKPVTIMKYEQINTYLSYDFIRDCFDSEEIETLVPVCDSSLNLSNKEIIFEEKNKSKVFLLSKRDANQLLSLQEKQQDENWWLSDGYVKSSGGTKNMDPDYEKKNYGVIPAIIVKKIKNNVEE